MKNNSEKFFYLLVPLLFTFPLFKENVSSMLFILLILNTVLYNINIKNFKLKNRETLLFTIPFGILILFTIIHFSTSKTLNPIKTGLFFLLFPITFAYIPKVHFGKEKIIFYLEILKNVCFIIAIGYLLGFLYVYDFSDFFVFKYEIPKFRDFVYNEISFFKIHPTYYTTIVFLCTAFSFEKVLKHKKYLELIYIAVFIMITFMLLVKINILLMVLLLFYMMMFRSSFALRQKIFGSFLLFFSMLILAISIPGVKNRFEEVIKSYNNPPKGLAYDSTNIRVSIYKCCYSIAQDNYIIGVGFGNLQTKLNDCYKSNYDSSFYENHNYMTHNYYNYILVSSGLLGFFFFLIYIAAIIRIAIKTNLFLFYVFVFNALIVCLIEDYLFRHFGCFYFNLILMCFVQYTKNNPASV